MSRMGSREHTNRVTGIQLNYVIVDLEATCWEQRTAIDRMEIIEIGAVCLDGDKEMQQSKEFERFVHPTMEPVLSDFCRNLTTITQHEVDHASYFPLVFEDFLDWIGGDRHTICSWGNYDMLQIQVECKRHRIELPGAFKQGINLKGEFAALRKSRPCGLMQAMRSLHMDPEGVHHRGIDDARNIAKIAQWLLPRIGR
jgi:3'-5' exoribonuclease 1